MFIFLLADNNNNWFESENVGQFSPHEMKKIESIRALMSAKKYEAASKQLTELVKSANPYVKSWAHYLFGECYFHHENYSKSLEYFTLASKSQVAVLNDLCALKIGECLRRLDKVDKAIEIFEKLLSSKFARIREWAHLRLGECHLFLYKFEKAHEYLEKALASESEVIREYAQMRMGEYYFFQRDFKKAIENLEKAVTSKQNDIKHVSLFALANCYFEQKEFEKAYKTFEKIDTSCLRSHELKILNLRKGLCKKVISNPGLLKQKQDGFDPVTKLENAINEKNMPEHIKKRAKDELARLEALNIFSHEGGVVANYLGWLTKLPWGVTTNATIDLKKAEELFNQTHYGLEKLKKRFLEFLAVQAHLKNSRGTVLLLVGPPGVGKTTFAKSVADAMGRKFQRVPLGGIHKESDLRGTNKTYVGSQPGKIIQAIIKSGVMNPVICLDEIDKMSSTAAHYGDPSAALLEILDKAQNNAFIDHYLEEAVDVSQVIFVATANGLNSIPRPLLDRMEIIEVPSYADGTKIGIAKNILIKKVMDSFGLTNIKFEDAAIHHMIRGYTQEAGVRGLERQIEDICRKVIYNKFSGTITVKKVEEYLGTPKIEYDDILEAYDTVGVVNGLAYNILGGATLKCECLINKGEGKIEFTGQLGKSMEESVKNVRSLVRHHCEGFGITTRIEKDYDIHINFPGGGKKDGPSAGVTIYTAMLSAVLNIPVRKDIAMTGEISLRGNVLPIGGLNEKLSAAKKAGIKKVLIPFKNKKDLDEVLPENKEGMEIVLIKHVHELLPHIFIHPPVYKNEKPVNVQA